MEAIETMKTEIRRESNHSWLVVQDQEVSAGYAVRMIEENRIPGLLSCSCRSMDGSLQLWYEITGFAPLGELLGDRKLKAQELLVLLESLCLSLDGLEEYLLGPDHLLLEPEFIYASQDLKQIFFCYIPARGKPPGEAFPVLTEYLLPRLDHRDPAAVTLGYGIYRYAMETEFGTDSLRAAVSRLMEKDQGIQSERKMTLEQEELWEQEEQDAEKKRREEAMRAFFEEEDQEEETDAAGKIMVAAAIVILLAYLAAGGWLWVRRSLWIGLWGLVGIVTALAGGAAYFLRNRRKDKGETPGKPGWADRVCEFPDRYKDGVEDVPEPAAVPCAQPDVPCAPPMGQGEQETCLLSEPAGAGAGYCLKEIGSDPMGQKPGQIFPFPGRSLFLIGKMQGTVDLVLSSPTISRIHARVRQQQGRWYLKDMNSKNGTYKNGERLLGEQETEIREGDELQFAERRYVFCREWTDIRQ